MAAPSPLPAIPAYEFGSKVGPMSSVKLITSAPGVADVYRAPAGYVNDDLCHPHDPPAALGDFYPKQKTP